MSGESLIFRLNLSIFSFQCFKRASCFSIGAAFIPNDNICLVTNKGIVCILVIFFTSLSLSIASHKESMFASVITEFI